MLLIDRQPVSTMGRNDTTPESSTQLRESLRSIRMDTFKVRNCDGTQAAVETPQEQYKLLIMGVLTNGATNKI